MARVVVVGGGFAGLSAAARLAKLRHDVTLVEAGPALGGRLRPHVVDGEHFAVCSPVVTLPGVFRDLFRKSGRPLEKVLGFEKIPGRRHLFPGADDLDLPLGNRGDQHRALETFSGDGDGWSRWLDGKAATWDALRTVALDPLFAGRAAFSSAQWKSLRVRRTIAKDVRSLEVDDRLVRVATDPLVLDGHDPRRVPAFVAVTAYVERSFGLWEFEGGTAGLLAALERRLDERRVDVVTGTAVTGLLHHEGRVRGVDLAGSARRADVVVWCAPPPPDLAGARLTPSIPASRTFVHLDHAAPSLPPEAIAHTDPPLRLSTTDPGHLTIEHRGGEDPLVALARCGLDLRPHVVSRHDTGPAAWAQTAHWGWEWRGWATACALPGVAPARGLFLAGAHAHPGPTLPLIGMATAAIADAVGKA